MAASTPRSPDSRPATNTETIRPPAELIVGAAAEEHTITQRDLQHSLEAEGLLDSLLPEQTTPARVFGDGATLQQTLRGTSEEDHGVDLLNTFSVIGAPVDLEELAEELLDNDDIAYAYVIPSPEPPIAPNSTDEHVETAQEDVPTPGPPTTPDFTARQLYLNAATDGVDARWAWTRPGGRGTGMHIIDIEGAWRFTHEDLRINQGGVIGGTQSTDISWRDHGTAVIGVMSGDVNNYGITGIVPEAIVRAISIFGTTGTPAAIRQAAQALSAGDIILIELHAAGPRHNYEARDDQNGYIAMEWWPAIFDAIRFAIARGVVVVEAAGNGSQDFDDPLYERPRDGFPTSWRNPLRSTGPDSGAIIVGAGAPPPGTNGRNHGPARSRLAFSNWGARVDAQGWGREVVTTGYGRLQGGTDEDRWYTDQFSGTSSASPIVVGAAAAYQGISAAGSGRVTPAQLRTRLRQTGSPQQDAPNRPATQHIGRLPDIRALVGARRIDPNKLIKDVKDRKTEKFETKELKVEKRETKELKIEKIEQKEWKNEKEIIKEKPEIKERIERDDKLVMRELDLERQQLIDQLQRLDHLEHIRTSQLDDQQDWAQQYGGIPQTASSEERLAAVEAEVGELKHFIVQALRPDLSEGALGYEDDDDWQEP